MFSYSECLSENMKCALSALLEKLEAWEGGVGVQVINIINVWTGDVRWPLLSTGSHTEDKDQHMIIPPAH